MGEKTSNGEDEILDEAIGYVIAESKGQTYIYPEGWDKNMKRSVRKRADRVTVRGVKLVYKKKDKAEVRIIQSSDEQMRILEMCHESCMLSLSLTDTFNHAWVCALCSWTFVLIHFIFIFSNFSTEVSSCVWVWGGNQNDQGGGANSANKLVPGGTNLVAVLVLGGLLNGGPNSAWQSCYQSKGYKLPYSRNIGGVLDLTVWRFSENPPNLIPRQYVQPLRNSARTLQSMALLNCRSTYLQREGPVLKCGTLAKKKKEQVNERMRQTVDEEAKVSMKRSVTCGTYTDYPPEDRAQIGRYAAENGPARATRHFTVSDTTGRRLQSKWSCHFVTSSVWDSKSAKFKMCQMPFMANLPNFMPANISHHTVVRTHFWSQASTICIHTARTRPMGSNLLGET